MATSKESISEKGPNQGDVESKLEEAPINKKETKKLEEFKDSDENKEVIAGINKKAGESKLAVKKKVKSKKEKNKEVIELEREYIVPLKKGVLNVPHYRRAKKAVRVLKEFIAQHMKVRDRDLNKIKIDMYLNNELWFKGIKKPANKIKVKAKKIDGIVYVELADISETVGYKMAWAEKQKAKTIAGKAKSSKQEKVVEEDKDKDGVNDKVEEKEDAKSGAEKAAKVQEAEIKVQRHTAQGKHAQKTMPIRKVLK